MLSWACANKTRQCEANMQSSRQADAQPFDEYGLHVMNLNQGGRGGQVGPPYALVQGVLAPSGTKFPDNLMESHQRVQRGMVGWVEGGPHFFISLANHDEWQARHAIFGQVLAEDMAVVEELAALPTRPATWSGITAAVLTESVRIIKVRKAESADKHRKSILKEPSH